MKIPYETLDPETLRGVLEEYVTREGTDYGTSSELLVKVDQIRRKLQTGEAVLCFDEITETCHILSREAFRTLDKSRVQASGPHSNGAGSVL